MQSQANTVADYLAELPPERRQALELVRAVFRDNLDPQYAEGMSYGMIGYFVPHSVYPAGYHCDPRQPLPFAGLASQKGHMSLYLMGLYCGCTPGESAVSAAEKNLKWFQSAWQKAGKKLDMGKACIRFKRVEDLALDVLAAAIRRLPVKKFIAVYEAAMAENKAAAAQRSAARKKAAAKTAAKSAARPSRKQAKKKSTPAGRKG